MNLLGNLVLILIQIIQIQIGQKIVQIFIDKIIIQIMLMLIKN
jgi:hypothetical protein